MAETFFISDTHFGHANILQYEPVARQFVTVEEMNEAMIDRWNRVVQPFDKVYHLGDFCFGAKNIEIAGRLNGQKRLVLGNHDIYPIPEYLKYFKSVHGVRFWGDCILTHVPVHPDSLGSRAKYNIHGHLHSKNVMRYGHMDKEMCVKDNSYINVSAEQNNLTPINADVILNRLTTIEEGA